MAEPPSLDKGEMTDKGSINQRAVLKNRAALADELYAEPLSPAVIAVSRESMMAEAAHTNNRRTASAR